MIGAPILIDTNVLVLYIAGSTARAIVDIHKRCSNHFTQEDYDSLVELLGTKPDLILLPHVVAEASNLLAQIANPYKEALLRTLKTAILRFQEVYVASRVAVSCPEYRHLRLTDCALLGAAEMKVHLLTVDFDFYRSFLRAGHAVTNFRHVIDHRQ